MTEVGGSRLDSSLGAVESVKVTCIENDYVESRGLLAEHGWSALVSTPNAKILVDIGQTSDVLCHNLSQLRVDLEDIDSIVITHGHYDHAGSILDILNLLSSKTELFAHPRIFEPKYSVKPRLRYIGLPRQSRRLLETRGGLNLSTDPLKLAEGVCTTGEIPRTTVFESPESHFKVKREGEFGLDYFEDELAVLVNVKNRGLLLISGCAHAGIVNTLIRAQDLTGERVWGLVGGLHLKNAEDSRVRSTIEMFRRLDLSLIAPAHCTGFKAASAIYQEFTDAFKFVSVGTELNSL